MFFALQIARLKIPITSVNPVGRNVHIDCESFKINLCGYNVPLIWFILSKVLYKYMILTEKLEFFINITFVRQMFTNHVTLLIILLFLMFLINQ